MNPEGVLLIDLYRDHGRVVRAEISSTRPFQAVKLLHGKTPEAALTAIPLMYNVCANAQALAGLQACRRALACQSSDAVMLAQQWLVDLESVREHLWRMSLEWPRYLGEQISANVVLLSQTMNSCRQALFGSDSPFGLDAALTLDAKALCAALEALQAFVETEVLGTAVNKWLSHVRTAEALTDWADTKQSVAARLLAEVLANDLATLGDIDAAHLPPLEYAALLQRFEAGDVNSFVSAPTWSGRCYETNSLSRQREAPLIVSLTAQFGTGLLTRLSAKLVEVATLIEKLNCVSELLIDKAQAPDVQAKIAADGAGQGIAQVEAARGRLVHWLEIDRGKVNDYRILAPTEWNFHPRGIAVEGLEKLAAKDDDALHRQAAYWLNAIDPCVGYELRLH